MAYPSYALLVADGDNMGIVVDAQETMELHGALSEALSAFAFPAPRKSSIPRHIVA